MKNNHQITGIRELNSKKKIIFIDENAAFSLYNSEVRQLRFEEGTEVSDEQLYEIEETILWPRAKERALNLLSTAWKTRGEILSKLEAGYYPETIRIRVAQFLEEYGYLNDYEYVKAYIREKCPKKSIRMIQGELRKKGVQEEVIQKVLAELNPDEKEAILKYISKKAPNLSQLDYKARSKLFMALLNKGYSYEIISEILNNSEYCV